MYLYKFISGIFKFSLFIVAIEHDNFEAVSTESG